MRAWFIDDYSGISGLRLREAADPVPAKNEVVLAVEYAGLNPADRYLAEKQYPARPVFPHILGRDGVGTVIATGAECTKARIGDRRLIIRGVVGGDRPGTFAERVAIPEDCLAAVPAQWTGEQAGGASLVYLTAWQALNLWGPPAGKAIVLVTGASGGVGIASLQIGAGMGFRMVCLSRSAEKRQQLQSMGAWLTFDPGDPEWRHQLKKRLGTERVTLAIDNIGGKLLPEVIETLDYTGAVSLVGRLAGPVPNFNTATLFFRRLRMGGVAVGTYTSAESHEAWTQLISVLERNNLQPLVDSVFDFEQLPRAFDRLAEGPLGKVVLRVTKSSPGGSRV